jgi:hypothetical protein
MIRPSLRHIAVLALCALLADPGALYAIPRASVLPNSAALTKGVRADFWDTFWSLLVSMWTQSGSSPDPYGGTKEGGALDPYGKPSGGQLSQPEGENGCCLDPNG